MIFAAARNQMSIVPLKVIQSKISQTDKSLRIEDYLLYRILRQKNEISKLKGQQEKKYTQSRQKQIRDKSNLIILLETFHEQVGVKDKKKKDRDRADETARKYLTHYSDKEKVGYIEEFEITKDKIIIKLPI